VEERKKKDRKDEKREEKKKGKIKRRKQTKEHEFLACTLDHEYVDINIFSLLSLF
jgi:hypothetical protein